MENSPACSIETQDSSVEKARLRELRWELERLQSLDYTNYLKLDQIETTEERSSDSPTDLDQERKDAINNNIKETQKNITRIKDEIECLERKYPSEEIDEGPDKIYLNDH